MFVSLCGAIPVKCQINAHAATSILLADSASTATPTLVGSSTSKDDPQGGRSCAGTLCFSCSTAEESTWCESVRSTVTDSPRDKDWARRIRTVKAG